MWHNYRKRAEWVAAMYSSAVSAELNRARVAAGQTLFELTAEHASGGADERVDGLLTVRRDEREQTRHLQIDELNRRGQALAARRASIETEIATRGQEIALQGAQVQHARDKLQRYAKLTKRGFVARSQLDDVSAELAAQQARRKALEGSLLSIRRDLLDVQEEVRGIDDKVALQQGPAAPLRDRGLGHHHQKRGAVSTLSMSRSPLTSALCRPAACRVCP